MLVMAMHDDHMTMKTKDTATIMDVYQKHKGPDLTVNNGAHFLLAKFRASLFYFVVYIFP